MDAVGCKTRAEVQKLTTKELTKWLRSKVQDFETEASKLEKQKIGGSHFLDLTQEELLGIQIPLGVAKDLVKIINSYSPGTIGASGSAPDAQGYIDEILQKSQCTTLIRTPPALLSSAGSDFPLVCRELAGNALWEAVETHLSHSDNPDKQYHPVAIACGSPGIGKSRLAMEVLNTIQTKAKEHSKFLELLDHSVHIGITFNMRSSLTEADTNPRSVPSADVGQHMLAVRILYSAFGQEIFQRRFEDFQKLFCRPLSVRDSLLFIRRQMPRSGDALICIVVDEFNKLAEGRSSDLLLRSVINNLCLAQADPPDGVRVVAMLAGTDWREANKIITKSLGVPKSLPLVLLDHKGVARVLDAISERLTESIGMDWRCSREFRALLQDVDGHPRLLERLVVECQDVLKTSRNDWARVESQLVAFFSSAYTMTLSQSVCRGILRSWFNSEPVHLHAAVVPDAEEATWAALFERGLIYLGPVSPEGKARIHLPWLWCRQIAAVAGLSLTQAAWRRATDPLQWWQDFEFFVLDAMVLRARILNGPKLRDLLRGSLLSPSLSKFTVPVTVELVQAGVSLVQYPKHTPQGLALDGTVCFKNGNGAPSDGVWPMCMASEPQCNLYIQMKNWEAHTQDASEKVTCDMITEEVAKANTAHLEAGITSSAIHLFVTSRPLDPSVVETALPENTAVVGPDQFQDFFGPLSSRAHFAAQTRGNVNCAPANVLRAIPGIGESKADAIVAARPFKDEGELRKRVPRLPEQFKPEF